LNEQVFLSAEPDHWCHVPELVNYSQTYSNLSLGHIKRLAIPRVDLGADRHDVVMYEKCFQYDVNFTDVYVKHGHKWPKRADPTWDRVPCKDGWDFDHSEYKDTLVTEVRHRKYLFVNRGSGEGYGDTLCTPLLRFKKNFIIKIKFKIRDPLEFPAAPSNPSIELFNDCASMLNNQCQLFVRITEARCP
jgi:hypothetical protein